LEPKEIRELIELISRSNFSTFEMERDNFRLKLVKGEIHVQAAAPAAATSVSPAAAEIAAPPPAPTAAEQGLVELNSPIVGTFYTASGPDSPDFASVGSKVKKGQTLCIVEAMKVMNEIESEIDAEVVEILVKNAQPIEFGEVLFRLRPL
jgi:acetyl-CoA carboxylase biotin carboxyl carrier protein